MPNDPSLPPITATQNTAGTATTTEPKATLINDAGQKVVVPAAQGNATAKSYFAQGYKLMGPDGKPVGTQTPPNFADVVNKGIADKIKTSRDKLLDPSQNLDTQLALQKGALTTALLEQPLTPEDLRWLSPSQQALIKSGKKEDIQATLGGLNSIIQTRADNVKAAQDAQDKANTVAMTKFNTLSDLGLLDKLSPDEQASLEGQLGLEPGSISQKVETPDITYKTSAGDKNTIIETGTDKTGKVVSMRVIGAGGTATSDGTVSSGNGAGGGTATDKTEAAFRKDVYDLTKGMDSETPGALDQAVIALRAKYPMFTSQEIRGILTDTQIPVSKTPLTTDDILAGIRSGGLTQE